MTASKAKRRDGWLVWAGTFLLFASLAHGSFETTDAAFTMHAARALLHRGDSALLTHEEGAVLASESAGARDIKFSEASNHRRNGKVGQNGHAYVWFPMGHVYGLVPFVALGEAVAALVPDADERLAARTTSYPRCAIEGTTTEGTITTKTFEEQTNVLPTQHVCGTPVGDPQPPGWGCVSGKVEWGYLTRR